MSEFQNIYLLKHRNYYERKLKRCETVAEYGNPLAVFTNINFPYGNGIDVSLTVNYDLNNGQPDYILVEDSDNGEFTRWYVLTSTLIRAGQCLLTLHRDVIADNLIEVLNATSYIEKATAAVGSPLIYANENITCNKIAKNQVIAANKNSVNYYYIYLAKTDNNNVNKQTISRVTTADSKTTNETIVETTSNQTVNWANQNIVVNTSTPSSDKIIGTYSSINEFYKSTGMMTSAGEFKHVYTTAQMSWYHTGSSKRTTQYARQVYKLNGTIKPDYTISYDTADKSNIYTGKMHNSYSSFYATEQEYANEFAEIYNTDKSLIAYIKQYINNYNENNMYYQTLNLYIKNYVGKYIAVKDSSGNISYYLVNRPIAPNYTDYEYENSYPDETSIAGKAILQSTFSAVQTIYKKHNIEEQQANVSWRKTPVLLQVYKSKSAVQCSVSEYTNGNITVYFPSTRNTTLSGYDIIAIPYVNQYGNTLEGNIRGNNINYTPDIVKKIVNKFSTTYGSSVILDIQLLPVTPFKSLEDVYGNLYTNQLTQSVNYIWAKSNDDVYRLPIFFLSDIDYNYSYSIELNQFTDEELNDPVKYKTATITKHWELIADNHAGTYELPIMYNNPSSYVNVNYNVSLFPYNPYIRIDIDYNNLNGENVSLARGLILSGNYSETQLSNAWTEYQYNNVNYNAIFNNQIAYQQAQNNYNNSNAWLDIGTNIGTSAAGIVAGAATGGIAGLAATGISLSGAANIGTSIVKQKRLESMQQTAIDYSKDQFALQLGNIQNKANVINKLTSYNVDNTVFPTIVSYDATDVEKTAIENKLKYNGMTIGVIDKFANYLPLDSGYIKGQIMYIDIQASAEYINVIADEMNKGEIYER